MKKLTKLMALLLCVCMLGALLCACGEEPANEVAMQDDMSQHVNLKWYIPSGEPTGFAEAMEAANEYLGEKLNVTLDLQCVDAGDYEQKLQLALASGEEFDIVWTASWMFNYASNVAKGAFLALDEYLELPELADLKNYYKPGVWDCVRIGGKIYAMPIEQVLYNEDGFSINKESTLEAGISEEQARAVKTPEDLEAIFDVVLEANKDNDKFYLTSDTQWTMFLKPQTKVIGNYVTGGLFLVDGKVTDSAEEYDDHYRRMREWNQKGYFPEGVATADLTGKQAYASYMRILPGSEEKQAMTSDNRTWIHVSTSDRILGREGVQSTMMAVNANSKNPIRALKLMHLMHTDEYMMNLICYGLEGRDFTRDPATPHRMERKEGSDAYYIQEFKVGSQFLCYLSPAYSDGVWEETKAANEAASVDPNAAFAFDSSFVESEVSQINSVASEYQKIMAYGLMDPEVSIPEYREKIKLAGVDAVMEEIQTQYDAWKANQE